MGVAQVSRKVRASFEPLVVDAPKLFGIRACGVLAYGLFACAQSSFVSSERSFARHIDRFGGWAVWEVAFWGGGWVKKNTQRRWVRLQQAILFAPEMSSLLLTRYLEQGTAWTDAQIQALRQSIPKQAEMLTWQQFAAVDLIELGSDLVDTLALLVSFQIPIDRTLRAFVEQANGVFQQIRNGNASNEQQDPIFSFFQMYGGEWQRSLFDKEVYPFLRFAMQLDSDVFYQRILESIRISSFPQTNANLHHYILSARCVDAFDILVTHAMQAPDEETQFALFGLLSKQKSLLHHYLEDLFLFSQHASEKVKRILTPLFAESTSPEILHFFGDGVITQIAAYEEKESTYAIEKKLEEVLDLALLPEHQVHLQKAFLRLPPILQSRLLPKLGEDASPEAGALLLRFFFGQATDLRYAASQGLLRYFDHHPGWLGRLVELDGILLQVAQDSAGDLREIAGEEILEMFAQTTGDWLAYFEAWEEQRAQLRLPSLFGHFRSGRALIARWIGDHREISYLPLLRGWFRLPNLDVWERSEIALVLTRFGDTSPALFVGEQIASLRDVHLFSDPQQNVLLAASLLLEPSMRTVSHHLQPQADALPSFYRRIVEARPKGAEQTALLMWLLQGRPVGRDDVPPLDSSLARLFLLLDLFSKPSFRIEEELLEVCTEVLEEILFDQKEKWDALGKEVCSHVVAYAASRLRFLPQRSQIQEHVHVWMKLLHSLASEEEDLFWKKQRESYEDWLFG